MATIGIFDSGVGGLSVLREIARLLPAEKYIYFSDNAYCPYGGQSQDLILERAREITGYLLFKGADIIVVACNTATAAAIAALRTEFSEPDDRVRMLTQGRRDHVKFIGMEPAVKPAALGTRTGVVGVLATEGTLHANKYLNTKEQWEGEARIVEHVGQGFVELVESGDVTGPHAEEVVGASLRPLIDEGADTIVLGCTHYPFLKDTIAKIAGPDIRIIDPAPAVARQLVKVMDEDAIPYKKDIGSPCGAPDVVLKASGSDEALKRTFSLIYL